MAPVLDGAFETTRVPMVSITWYHIKKILDSQRSKSVVEARAHVGHGIDSQRTGTSRDRPRNRPAGGGATGEVPL